MRLGNRELVDETRTNVVVGDTFYLGINDGKIALCIAIGDNTVGVSAETAVARQIAATLLEMVNELEADNA